MSTRCFLLLCLCLPALLLTLTPACAATAAPPGGRVAGPPALVLAGAGKANQQVVVAAAASETVKATAQVLAEMLRKISGAPFTVTTGDGRRGLAVGLFTDFPAVKTGVAFAPADPRRREEYLLRTHAQGAYLLGATEVAVQDAVWDFLYRLGYRQFFPHPDWEVIPRNPSPRLALNALETPDYYARSIWYGYGSYPANTAQLADWRVKNRAQGSIILNTGHSYDGIISNNRAVFDAHPEYLALTKDPKTGAMARGGDKFCIANPELRALAVDYCLKQFAANPALDSISLDPSDGGGWCECEACVKLGSVTDRVVTLANQAAEAIVAKYPGKLVGIYAYYMHSPPPTITVHPNVVVSAATAFSTLTIDQLLDGWSAKKATMGVREYYAVNVWTRDLPGAASGTKLDYLQQTIPHFYAKGVRFMSAESGDCWGPNGLGYYFAQRMLWDTAEGQRKTAIVDDFLTKAFGPAKAPMAEYYRLLDGSTPQLMSDDLVGRMYRRLQAARALTADRAIRARIDDLILYTRYVDLFAIYSAATGEARQQAFEALIRYAYRIRETGMIHTLALYRDLPARDRSVQCPPNGDALTPDAQNPWKQDPPVTPAEIDAFLAEGIARNKLIDFTPVSFSKNLTPATPLNLPDVPDGQGEISTRYPMTFYTWVPKGAHAVTAEYFGNGRVFTWESPKHAIGTPLATVDLRTVPGVDQKAPKQQNFETPYEGLHTLTADGSTNVTISVRLRDGLPLTVASDAPIYYRWYLYFYVPKGTKVIGGYSEANTGSLLGPDGKPAFDFTAMARPGYFSVPVPAGMDGKLWKMHFVNGRKILLTVPPYYARNARELLLPAEVVAKDAAKR